MTHKKLKIILSMVVSVFVVLIVAVVGGVWYMNNKFNQNMIKIANSQQAKKIYKTNLKNMDNLALTNKGIIKSYKVDQKNISHNPMGGIDVTLIINNDPTLNMDITLDRNTNGTTLDDGGEDDSPQLGKLVNGDN